jgi:hypothetical protein
VKVADRYCWQNAVVPGLVGKVESKPLTSCVMVRLMALNDRITLIIEGLPEAEGQVRFTAFMSQLQSLGTTLNKLGHKFLYLLSERYQFATAHRFTSFA